MFARLSTRVSLLRPAKQVRSKTSLIPPNVASLKEIGRLQSQYPHAHPEIFGRLKTLYKALPKGAVEYKEPTTFGGWYYEKYVEKGSFMPIAHVIMVLVPIGYYIQYFKGGHYHPTKEFH